MPLYPGTDPIEIIQNATVEEHGYNFCTICNNNNCKPVDCAHLISVDECQKSGQTELAWDLENMVPAGRPCHKKMDGVELKFSNNVDQ